MFFLKCTVHINNTFSKEGYFFIVFGFKSSTFHLDSKLLASVDVALACLQEKNNV